MAKLSSHERNALPDSAFAGPGRSYPVEDKGHAMAALSRASAAEHEGRISAGTEAKIAAKAHKKLHGDGSGHWSGK